jgi:hypothetical protein
MRQRYGVGSTPAITQFFFNFPVLQFLILFYFFPTIFKWLKVFIFLQKVNKLIILIKIHFKFAPKYERFRVFKKTMFLNSSCSLTGVCSEHVGTKLIISKVAVCCFSPLCSGLFNFLAKLGRSLYNNHWVYWKNAIKTFKNQLFTTFWGGDAPDLLCYFRDSQLRFQ